MAHHLAQVREVQQGGSALGVMGVAGTGGVRVGAGLVVCVHAHPGVLQPPAPISTSHYLQGGVRVDLNVLLVMLGAAAPDARCGEDVVGRQGEHSAVLVEVARKGLRGEPAVAGAVFPESHGPGEGAELLL